MNLSTINMSSFIRQLNDDEQEPERGVEDEQN